SLRSTNSSAKASACFWAQPSVSARVNMPTNLCIALLSLFVCFVIVIDDLDLDVIGLFCDFVDATQDLDHHALAELLRAVEGVLQFERLSLFVQGLLILSEIVSRVEVRLFDKAVQRSIIEFIEDFRGMSIT